MTLAPSLVAATLAFAAAAATAAQAPHADHASSPDKASHHQHQHQHHAKSPYSGMEARSIKALSPEQIAELREGKGMGASLPAELNGAPGPMHVLQLSERLRVSEQQQAALVRITAAMKEQAQALGAEVVAAEVELDRAFARGTADEAMVRTATARIGELQGRLRAVHLVAHLQTKSLLSREQIAAYDEARGYKPAAAAHRH